MTELRLEKICYRYPKADKQVLKGVSCIFSEGELSAIVGPSGSGKTTLLSVMAGMDEPDSGEITVNGEARAGMDLDRYRRETISMIFQSFQLFPLLTVEENVCYPMDIRGVSMRDARNQAAEALRLTGIGEELWKRFPANLSGGEQQRVAIARALASGAKILLADEPTGNLDQENTENILGILQMLAHERDYCVIVVTHDMQVAELSDKVWRMRDGVLEEE